MANTKITTAVIKDDAITTAKIADDAVTGALIADDVALAGNPTTTTQSAGNNTTRIATTAFVTTAINNLVDSAPAALDTLNELAAALGDDANFSTTITNSVATKAPLAGPTFTGDVDIDATDDLRLRFLRGSTFKAGIQVPTSTNDMISGAAIDDLAIRSQANVLFASGGNTERMRIDSNGNVGIGQENPDQKLVVESSSDSQVKIVSGSSNDAYLTFFNGTTLKHYFKQDNSGLFELYYYDGSAANSRIAMDTSGNLALGHTTTSGAKFIVSNGGAASFQFFPEISTDTNLTQHYDLAASAYMHAETRASSHSFKIGTVEHMKVSDGEVNIGGSSAANRVLEIKGASNNDGYLGTFGSGYSLQVARHPLTGAFNNTSTAAAAINLFTASADSSISFYTTTSNNANPTERAQIDKNGNLILKKNLVLESTSEGIDFSGVGSSAQTLDAYEEGTHDCVVTMDSGSCTLYSSYNKIKYTKIGRVVFIQGQIRVQSVSSPSGTMQVSMPFSINTTDDEGTNVSGSVVRTYNGNAPTGGLYLHGVMVFNRTNQVLLQWVKSGSITIDHVPVANEYLLFNFSYCV